MTLPPSYFDDLYAGATDPWGFEDRWYERRKRALTLALLPAERYATGYEPGCSIGVLTRELAERCDALLATDVSDAAVTAARARVSDLPHVTVERATLPADWPDRDVDLVVLSEVGYYFAGADLDVVAERACSAGTLVAVHWRHPVDDYPTGGDEVHAVLTRTAAAQGLSLLGGYEDSDILAAVWRRDPRSVGDEGGLT